ncbi:hypothetical protein [Burkholderia cepacia]|uniref:hypothetical protein n=1 Tax=Burkholderia cepacia TaxID=292 RepID=UPI001577560C|nr:hypothetical protein [Burkholderia cepacia]
MSRPDTGSASALTKEAVMQEAQERVYRDSDDNRTGDVLGFGEWICDKLATCAGSLTDEQTLARAAELLDTQGLSPARDYAADNIRKLLAMSPAERPVLTDERTAFVKFWREVDEMDAEKTAKAAFAAGMAFARTAPGDATSRSVEG